MQELYSASMLLLLKLWKDIKAIKSPSQSWDEAYKEFQCTISTSIQDTIGNLQFYYDCWEAATRDSEEDMIRNKDQVGERQDNHSDNDDNVKIGEEDAHQNSNFNEDALQALIMQKQNMREATHG